jgi:3-deoxy-D-manno-octulosonic-acid transferase
VAPLAADLDAALAGNAVLVAGSTHAGEEEAALDAFTAVESGGARAVLVLAPRHLDRADQVEALVRARGRRLCRRTRLAGALAPGEVLILDTLGELAALYGRAVSAFVGGTLAPVGGHNLLEPVFAGAPVCFGSHTEAVRHAEAPLLASGAGRRVDDARALAAVWSGDLLAPDAARARAAAGQRALRPHAGSTERSLALLDAVLARAAAEPRA